MLYALMAVLSVIAVSLWWRELSPFIDAMDAAFAGPKWLIPIRTFAALPKLLPLVFDVLVTITFIAWFGGSGITSLVISLVMSVTVSLFLNARLFRQARLKRQAQMRTAPASDGGVA